jgi:hypothetical protein
MPQSLSLQNGQSFTIPEKVYQLDIQMWGAGGAGEDVNNSFTRFPGGNGGNTQLLGLIAYGGAGGRTPGGGGAGGGGTTFNWASLGVGITTASGSNGSTPTAGNGALLGGTRYGNGGSGDPGTTTYISNVYHIFNNDTNQHIVQQNSPDIFVTYNNPWASDGVPCGMQSYGKNYGVYFYNAFTNSTYNISIYGVCQQTAGGGSGKAPYSLDGIGNKTSSGFQIWFKNRECINSYIRCFSIQATGTKAGAQGMGGGGGGAVSASFPRTKLIDSGTYAPGTTHTAIVGSGGSGGYGAGSGGRINIYMLIVPTVTITVNNTEIIIGGCVSLSWVTTGDADKITWLSGNVNNGLLTSSETVCPQETTTYTIQASGAGGLSEPASVTVYVFYVATCNITGPSSIDYGDTLLVSFETQYADISITLTPLYYFVDGSSSIGTAISVNPAITAESGRPDSQTVVSSQAFEIPVTWNTVGPERIEVQLVADGRGGSSTDVVSIDVNIDITPDNIIIPETEDAFKEQDPVITPETDILTDLLYIDGIDIPVEVKSNYPLKVDINQEGIWKDLREI